MTSRTAQCDWWATPPRAALLLLTGFVLGPHGLEVLRTPVVHALAPLMPIALASLGMLVVLERSRRTALELGGLLVPAIVLVFLVPELTEPGSLPFRGLRAVQAAGVAILIGDTGTLLLADPTRIARRVYLLGLVLLLGGVADFLSAPALLSGAAGGLVLGRFVAKLGDGITHDLQYFTRPLATALLVLAGAQINVTDRTVLLAGAWVLAVVLWRRTSHVTLQVGIYSVAVALDASHGFGDVLTPLISAGALAVITIQGASFFSTPGETAGLTTESVG
jgi:hypothetical protein